MTFAGLAREVYCSRQYLARCFESGKMRASYFRRICTILDIDPQSILATEDWIPPPQDDA